ncbi:hypothetical protein [Wielerella bovis]|uniref:hypothetical protein n=1 Tax=Wielerella bovis TaxID=2917790 RepID=UPI002019D30F|nr:hypothetical protein [Wielerella bovis]MCG7656563.1 hypothetical protein [Wielerella bovis]MCG7658788.1 hypothetical protein [Wielerella bovis]
MSKKWIYREDSGFVMFICFLVVCMLFSIPFLVFIFDEQTRHNFLNKSLKDMAYALLFLGVYFALFLAFANAIYQNNVKNWLKSFIRPDYLAAREEGLYYKFQGEEKFIEWKQIWGVKEIAWEGKLILLLSNGTKEFISTRDFAKPLDQTKYFILCFVMPVAGVIKPWLGALCWIFALLIGLGDEDVICDIMSEINRHRRKAFLGDNRE